MATRRNTTQSFGWLSKKHGLTEAEIRDMDVRYKNADLDRSGQLDREELKSLLKSTIAHGMSDLQLDTYLTSQWHNVDKDNSGSVDFDEFLALYAILKLEAQRSRRSGRPIGSTTGAATGAAGQSGASAGAAASQSGTSAGSAAGAAGAAAGAAAKSAASKSSAASASSAGQKRREKRKPRKNRKHAQRTFTPSGALTQQNYLSNEIVWSALQEHHSFLLKRGTYAVFSTEPGNLRNLHSMRSSGLATNKTVDLSGNTEGLTLRLRADSKRRQSTPARQHVSQTYKQPNRVMARKLRSRLNAYGRGDLTNAALARMTRIRQSLGAAGGVTKKTQRTRGARRAGNK